MRTKKQQNSFLPDTTSTWAAVVFKKKKSFAVVPCLPPEVGFFIHAIVPCVFGKRKKTFSPTKLRPSKTCTIVRQSVCITHEPRKCEQPLRYSSDLMELLMRSIERAREPGFYSVCVCARVRLQSLSWRKSAKNRLGLQAHECLLVFFKPATS